MEQQRFEFDTPLVAPLAPLEALTAPPVLPPASLASLAPEASGMPGVPEETPPSDSPIEFVRHPRARRYLIRVRADGSVRVTIPRRGSKRDAAAFFDSQREWVRRQQTRVADLQRRRPADLPADMQRQLRARAKVELLARLLELAASVGLVVTRISIRNQRRRWGSCSPSGLICLNWRLVTMPDWVRDYVLYHELMHLKRMDHSKTFWKLVAEVCPNYEEARRWLRRHALAPHAGEGCVDGDDATSLSV